MENDKDKPSIRRRMMGDCWAAMKTAESPLFFNRPARAIPPPIIRLSRKA